MCGNYNHICPGLVVMGDASGSRGCEFESRHRILEGHSIDLF